MQGFLDAPLFGQRQPSDTKQASEVALTFGASSGAERAANPNALIRAQVVDNVALEDCRHALDLAQLVRRVVVARARDGVAGREHVHFTLRVHVPQEAAGDDGDDIIVIIHSREVLDLQGVRVSQ